MIDVHGSGPNPLLRSDVLLEELAGEPAGNAHPRGGTFGGVDLELTDTRRGRSALRIAMRVFAVGVLLLCTTGCVTRFRTGVPLSELQRRVVTDDLAIAGVLARHPGLPGARLPGATSRLARLTGGADVSSQVSDQDLVALLASPGEIRSALDSLQNLSRRLGHRYVIVGEASTAPTDEHKSWIIQVVIPIPYVWISFGIPVNYASNADVPHATKSTRVIDLREGKLLAASFEVSSKIDSDDELEFANSEVARAVKRMLISRP